MADSEVTGTPAVSSLEKHSTLRECRNEEAEESFAAPVASDDVEQREGEGGDGNDDAPGDSYNSAALRLAELAAQLSQARQQHRFSLHSATLERDELQNFMRRKRRRLERQKVCDSDLSGVTGESPTAIDTSGSLSSTQQKEVSTDETEKSACKFLEQSAITTLTRVLDDVRSRAAHLHHQLARNSLMEKYARILNHDGATLASQPAEASSELVKGLVASAADEGRTSACSGVEAVMSQVIDAVPRLQTTFRLFSDPAVRTALSRLMDVYNTLVATAQNGAATVAALHERAAECGTSNTLFPQEELRVQCAQALMSDCVDCVISPLAIDEVHQATANAKEHQRLHDTQVAFASVFLSQLLAEVRQLQAKGSTEGGEATATASTPSLLMSESDENRLKEDLIARLHRAKTDVEQRRSLHGDLQREVLFLRKLAREQRLRAAQRYVLPDDGHNHRQEVHDATLALLRETHPVTGSNDLWLSRHGDAPDSSFSLAADAASLQSMLLPRAVPLIRQLAQLEFEGQGSSAACLGNSWANGSAASFSAQDHPDTLAPENAMSSLQEAVATRGRFMGALVAYTLRVHQQLLDTALAEDISVEPEKCSCVVSALLAQCGVAAPSEMDDRSNTQDSPASLVRQQQTLLAAFTECSMNLCGQLEAALAPVSDKDDSTPPVPTAPEATPPPLHAREQAALLLRLLTLAAARGASDAAGEAPAASAALVAQVSALATELEGSRYPHAAASSEVNVGATAAPALNTASHLAAARRAAQQMAPAATERADDLLAPFREQFFKCRSELQEAWERAAPHHDEDAELLGWYEQFAGDEDLAPYKERESARRSEMQQQLRDRDTSARNVRQIHECETELADVRHRIDENLKPETTRLQALLEELEKQHQELQALPTRLEASECVPPTELPPSHSIKTENEETVDTEHSTNGDGSIGGADAAVSGELPPADASKEQENSENGGVSGGVTACDAGLAAKEEEHDASPPPQPTGEPEPTLKHDHHDEEGVQGQIEDEIAGPSATIKQEECAEENEEETPPSSHDATDFAAASAPGVKQEVSSQYEEEQINPHANPSLECNTFHHPQEGTDPSDLVAASPTVKTEAPADALDETETMANNTTGANLTDAVFPHGDSSTGNDSNEEEQQEEEGVEGEDTKENATDESAEPTETAKNVTQPHPAPKPHTLFDNPFASPFAE